ncbi:hypothetical protein BLNAU_8559 [Blattamonas nauphoetae]|uniref:Uncharacterized protein n=1 Tax=Blattamonas nauphoetae TaxID=2049346 RepID=A0ABQ9XYD1_9EUKA|nr:hypothetical protein BLNAU_8559 [Blattamonas nauphoetae]
MAQMIGTLSNCFRNREKGLAKHEKLNRVFCPFPSSELLVAQPIPPNKSDSMFTRGCVRAVLLPTIRLPSQPSVFPPNHPSSLPTIRLPSQPSVFPANHPSSLPKQTTLCPHAFPTSLLSLSSHTTRTLPTPSPFHLPTPTLPFQIIPSASFASATGWLNACAAKEIDAENGHSNELCVVASENSGPSEVNCELSTSDPTSHPLCFPVRLHPIRRISDESRLFGLTQHNERVCWRNTPNETTRGLLELELIPFHLNVFLKRISEESEA